MRIKLFSVVTDISAKFGQHPMNFTAMVGVDPKPQVSVGTRQDDTLTGTDMRDIIHGRAGDDSVFGGEGSDFLFGGKGDDGLFGGAGNDRVFGGKGDDTIDGGAGSDVLDGGRGFDTALYAGSVLDYVIAPLCGNRLMVTDTATGDRDWLRSIEVLQFDDATIYLDGRNNAPVAFDDAATTDEDSALTLNAADLVANDYDFEGDALTVTGIDHLGQAG